MSTFTGSKKNWKYTNIPRKRTRVIPKNFSASLNDAIPQIKKIRVAMTENHRIKAPILGQSLFNVGPTCDISRSVECRRK